MSKSLNKSYRIKTNIGTDKSISVNLEQDYDVLNILSLKIDQKNAYRLHTSDYGVIAGRVLANEAFGIPNAKINVFIPRDKYTDDIIEKSLYPYNTFNSKNKDSIRFNLLPDSKVSDCHSVVGTFPSKRYVLDNDNILEIFEKYFNFTTRTNNAGDFMIFGVPVGIHDIHVDIDLSDIGILSQKPRDMVYKGYNITQFENPNKFKESKNLETLPQIITQDISANVIPFWGDLNENEIGITRCDININYKFEPTCVFIGSVVSDNSSNGITKRCTPTKNMGAMDELTTGSGTIEMIRKKPDDTVEEFQIQGTQLINGDGIWCYQIPMNLDYMMTDEYGNMVPTDNPNKGIPTRTKVRFRISLQDFENSNSNMLRGKMLVPNNPEYKDEKYEEPDYNFGTLTRDDSYRDLFWNGVYSVKSFIPRFQKGDNWKNSKYSGIKRCNYFNSNNPIPYNNIRIKLPLMYILLCAIIKTIIWFISLYNRLIQMTFMNRKKRSCMYITGELCPELADSGENWYFAPRCCVNGYNDIKGTGTSDKDDIDNVKDWALKQIKNTRNNINDNEIGNVNGNQDVIHLNDDDNQTGTGGATDKSSIDFKNRESFSSENDFILSTNITSFIQCIEMNLADEYRVIQFEFYNDWINGMIYIPRWMRSIRKKQSYLFGLIKIDGKIKACNEESNFKKINYIQKCSIHYSKKTKDNYALNPIGCDKDSKKLNCHKGCALDSYPIFGNDGGIVNSTKTSKGQYVYYFKPCEIKDGKKVNLYATDIILLGTLNNCDKWGIPNSLSELKSSTYQMPQNNVLISNSIDNQHYHGGKYKYGREIHGEFVRLDVEGMTPEDFEDGSYTEMAGIDWGITGPLQNRQEPILVKNKETNDFEINKKYNYMFRPGGHFLGLSCHSSETSILSCVNLYRICEHGVWMSQRHEIQVPKEVNIRAIGDDENGNYSIYNTYNVNPTGLISKDEISDTEYRSIFATLNQNRLRTIKDENGKLKYDFSYIYPTNFGGELRLFIDGEYNEEKLKNKHNKTYENEKRRTGEFTDDEYLKFRLGINENVKEEKKKHFLIEKEDYLAIPVYENSFYFYFGLHDGSTALDEFKRQYYSICQKNVDLISSYSDKIIISNIKTIPYGYCNKYKKGKFSFNLEYCNEDIFPITIYCKNENGDNINMNGKEVIDLSDATYTVNYEDKSSDIVYSMLDLGEYTIFATNSKYETKTETFIIENIKYGGNVYSENFYKSFDNNLSLHGKEIMQYDRKEYGGYIALSENTLIDNGEKIKIFKTEDNYVIENQKYGVLEDGVKIELEFNGKKVSDKFNFGAKIGETYYEDKFLINDNGDCIIPVPKAEEEYTLSVSFKKNKNCEKDNNDIFNIWSGYGKVGSAYINMPSELDFTLNELSYNHILSKINGWENEEELGVLDNSMKWYIKKLCMKYKDTPKSINVNITGGNIPYTQNYSGQYENKYGDDSIELVNIEKNQFPLRTINIPTRNYGNIARDDFGIYVNDSLKGRCPKDEVGEFILPIIFKPFFMESCILKNCDTDKTYISGSVYNGITYDYKKYGFNNCFLNDILLNDFIDIKGKDDFYLEDTYKMYESDISKLPIIKNGYGQDFSFGNRKCTFGKEIRKSSYGLDKNNYKSLKFQIGSKFKNENVDDSCNTTSICYNATAYSISFGKEGNNIYAYIEGENEYNRRKIYEFYNENSYEYYPFIETNLQIDKCEKLLNYINKDIEENNNVSDKEKIILQTDKKNVFYAVSSNNREDDNFESSNFLNKFNMISITNLYDIKEISKWLPMNLKYSLIKENDKYLIKMQAIDEETKNLIVGKKMDILFYLEKNDYSPIHSINRRQPNSDGSLKLDITLFSEDLINGKTKMYISQNIYEKSSENKQPFRYKKTELIIEVKKINLIKFTTIKYEREGQEINVYSDYEADYELESAIDYEINGGEFTGHLNKGAKKGRINFGSSSSTMKEGDKFSIILMPSYDDVYEYKCKVG